MIETSIAQDGKTVIDVKAASNTVIATLDVRNIEAVAIDCTLSGLAGGATPSVQFFLDRLVADGTTWVQIANPAAITTNGTVTILVGPGLPINSITGRTLRVRCTTTGAPTTANAAIAALGDRYSG